MWATDSKRAIEQVYRISSGRQSGEHFSTGNHYFRLEPMYEWSDNRYVARLIGFASNIGLAEKTTTKTLSLLHFLRLANHLTS